MSKKAKNSKVEFKDVIEGDKLTIKWDVVVTKIEDFEEYLSPVGAHRVRKVSCVIKNGPFKDKEGVFAILDEDRVLLHSRPSLASRFVKFWFGSKKSKKK